jgi:hypothetical protein
VITSPRHPHNYPNNTDCLWRIRVHKEKVLSITITSLDIEEGYDFLEVKQGRYFTISPFARRYTGKSKVPIQLTILSNSAWIRFSSDELINAPGFRLTYKAQRNRCPRISAPHNGFKREQNRNVGGHILFECKKKFCLVGDRRIKCLATGRWSNNPPLCTGMPSSGIVINQTQDRLITGCDLSAKSHRKENVPPPSSHRGQWETEAGPIG